MPKRLRTLGILRMIARVLKRQRQHCTKGYLLSILGVSDIYIVATHEGFIGPLRPLTRIYLWSTHKLMSCL